MRCLILPCETHSREFDAKLLLAVMAAGRGVTSVVGSKKPVDLNLTRYPPGVYIGKSLTDRSRLSLTMARACGHRLALWDEEGLVWASPEVYWRTKIHGPNLALPELLIAWGDDNASAWRTHPDYPGTPIVVAGNPRVDLLHPRLQACFSAAVAEIRRTHGRFVLINTNFSRVNNFQPRQNRHLKWLRENRPQDPRGGFARHKYRLYQAFLEMLPRLAASLPDIRFVVRPHPSEDLAVWQRIAAAVPNVTVERRGNVLAWLKAADGLVHNGCTTAVEGFMVGCPALAYMPVISPDYDHPLPNGVSLPCRTLDDLEHQVRAATQGRASIFAIQAGDAARRDMMRRSIAGFDQSQMACERILDALAPLLSAPVPGSRLRRGASATLLRLRRLVNALARRVPGSAQYQPYIDHMFPPTPLAETRQRVAVLAQCLGLAEIPAVSEAGPNVFRVRPFQTALTTDRSGF